MRGSCCSATTASSTAGWAISACPATFVGVVAGAVLVSLPAAGDFANSEFLGSPSTSMIGNVINQTFNQGGYVPLGGTLTVCFMVGIAAFMVFYLRSAARASREGAL